MDSILNIFAAEGQRPGNMPAQGNALGSVRRTDKALKGRDISGTPLQGFALFFISDTQGGARSSLALGWHVTGPLALKNIGMKVPCIL